ncbi:hypothetical protein, variant 2 [Plasmopara halstedii]|uniref:RING-type domain-containing protein n=1 Tax=Plasmopara halstedii TaxID=4781 RepID=A0A0P1AJ48_PLAHL|nr:hypothetical protein, variant 2 [Plasmopara halstedii]CEG41200.1 hypothetical protein, variant 2 [Plasmopara halstedii]|eukprot:XP_024577569.1 hypothetical protein, variant 2 [Plasmopara halstedii]
MKNRGSRNISNGGPDRRGPRREQNKNMNHEARVTRNGVSANHLLNFSLPEREHLAKYHHKKKKSSAPRTQIEYLHANYRFVIAPLDPECIVPTWDVESLTEWSLVEQVLLWYDAANPQTCPICMDSFRVPKITKCGHIFCWPCILRYLSMTDKYWRRCPMCFESVQKGHLRSVQLQQLQIPPRVGSDVTFQFLERPKSRIFPQLRVLPSTQLTDDCTESSAFTHSSSEAATFAARKRTRKLPNVNDADATYSRILEATPEYLRELLLAEMRVLQSMDAEFQSSGDVDNLPFVNEAMRNTSERLSISDDCSRGTYGKPVTTFASDQSIKPLEHGTNDMYSFYQIANGTYVILHPLNMKCLLKEYTDELEHENAVEVKMESTWTTETSCANSRSPPANRYHLVPEQVHGRVLDIEHFIMDEEAQKRFRFLSHLPRFCDFYICELDLSSQLSRSTLSAFKNDLKKRAKQREHKLKLLNTPTFSSPMYKSKVQTFSLQHENTHWPSPYEQTLAESVEDFHLSSSFASDLLTEDETTTSFEDDERSFARITENSGYFPALGDAPSNESRHPSENSTASGSSHPWGNTISSNVAGRGSKKKGGKKGISVFSTTQRRSYR